MFDTFTEEVDILNKMTSELERDDTTCMCDGCIQQDEFVERLRSLAEWAKKEQIY